MEKLLNSELSASTLLALQQHIAESKESLVVHENNEKPNALISEDFRLSQFWYDDESSRKYATEAYRKTEGGTKGVIAFISSPAAFQMYKEIYPDAENEAVLLEIDDRFEEIYPDSFFKYNYNSPIDPSLSNLIDCVTFFVVDPPHHNTQCMDKYMETINHLSAKNEGVAVVFATGAVLEEYFLETLKFEVASFVPSFNSKLSNPYFTYVNYSDNELKRE